MRRRNFITLLGGAAATWSLVAHAEQSERVRRIGVLMPSGAGNREYQLWVGAFLQEMSQLGWNIGRNVRIETRWAATNADIRKNAVELVALAAGMSFSLMAATQWGSCCRQHTPFRSYSRLWLIQSPQASSTAWRGRAAMLPVSCFSKQHRWKMAGVAEANRARGDAGGGYCGSHYTYRTC